MPDGGLQDYIAVLQAGGKGTRMRELTHDRIPKPLLPLGGRPMLEWQILNIKKYGVRDFVIIVGHLGEQIEAYFGNGEKLDVSIRYIKEKEPLGSGGALYFLKDMLGEARHIILTLGDVMFDVDLFRLAGFHQRIGAMVTLTVHPNAHPYDSDIVVIAGEKNDVDKPVAIPVGGKVVSFDSKKNVRDYWYDNCVNAGLYMLEAKVLEALDDIRYRDLEKEIFMPYMERGLLYAYRTTEYLKDAGTVQRYHAVGQELSRDLWEQRNLANKQKCVFLDRDGTINRYVGLLSNIDDLELEDGAAQAVQLLNEAGFLAIVVSNQPVVARGLCSVEEVCEINSKMGVLLGREGAYFDDVVFCPHHPDKGYAEENPLYKRECRCRKPDVGMIMIMKERHNIELKSSWLVGDSARDIECGKKSGLRTVLVQTGETRDINEITPAPDYVAKDVLAAVRIILSTEQE